MKKILFGLLLIATIILGGCTTNEQPITNFEECVAAGNEVMESYPQQCVANGETFTEEIEEEVICTKEYKPVCGEIQVQCVTTPCDPQPVTFSNECEAKAAGAINIKEGVCEDKDVNLKGACLSFDGIWNEEYQECEGMSQEMCEELNGVYNGCDSACRHDPDAEFCTMQCIQTCTFE